METAQIMQEELQRSVLQSEEDAEFEEDGSGDAKMKDAGEDGAGPSVPPPLERKGDDEGLDTADDAIKDHASDQDEAEGDPADDDEYPSQNEHGSDSEAGDMVLDEEGLDEEDAEGEEDEEIEAQGDENGVSDAEMSGAEEDEAEGVGAVKIKPGETDEDDESGSDGGGSVSVISEEEEWEGGVENDENEEEGEEESELAASTSNNCIFCKKDEESDPAEEFEAYLACKGCGEHSHQQCARDAGALHDGNSGTDWKCPDCVGDDAESGSEAGSTHADAEMNGGEEDAQDGEDEEGLEAVSPSSRRSTASRLARDLLPAHRGMKQDAHSVFNQLVLDEDPMDGSRVLRKRKTSSIADEDVLALRKRRKTTSEEAAPGEPAKQDQASGADEPTRPRSARFRLKNYHSTAPCTTLKKSRKSLLISMRVEPESLRQILSQVPKSKKRSSRTAASRAGRLAGLSRNGAAAPAVELPMAPFMPSSYTQPFYSFYDKDTDELKGKPYGGILTEAEADTSKTLPTKDDRRRFDEAKQKADDTWRQRLMELQKQNEAQAPVKKSKRNTEGPASQIECVEFGGWEIDTWYAAPYPEEYSRNRVLYICEFCLKYMNSDYVAWRHKLKCPAKHPPGDEIYRQGSVSFFEVDGRKNPVYCQNLCLLAKLFLGSKTLYYDVEPFLFYVLCEYDSWGYHFVGYFSKEKRASSQNNVSCILTLPIHQRKGYGNLLIDFSYLLTRVEEKTGSPEKPLSDMGLVSYRNYWRLVMCKYLLEHTPDDKSQKRGLSIRQISDDTGMMPDDVISALEGLRCLVRDPQTKLYAFRVDLAFCREYVATWEAKSYVKLNDKALAWTPYVMGRSNATNFELGPALTAIAPREEDEDAKPVSALAASGIATGDFADTNGSNQKPVVELTSSVVLESTEPNDKTMDVSDGAPRVNGVGQHGDEAAAAAAEAAEAQAQAKAEAMVQAGSATQEPDDDDWQKQYGDIPAFRFEVFPPVNSKRPNTSRMSSSIARPVIRAPATVPRPRPKRPAGSARKTTTTRPKSTSTARRKTGGTGRGPGRWPKGTKKSDYGNANSGRGLPPGWLERQREAAAQAKDTVEVKQTKEKVTTGARFEVKDEAQAGAQGGEEGVEGEADNTQGDQDVVMADAGGEPEGGDEEEGVKGGDADEDKDAEGELDE